MDAPMSDHDVRRMVRDLLRTGLNVEETLELVLEELRTAFPGSGDVVVRSAKTTHVIGAGYLGFQSIENVEYHVYLRRVQRVKVSEPTPDGTFVVTTATEASNLMEEPRRLPRPEDMLGYADQFGGSDQP